MNVEDKQIESPFETDIVSEVIDSNELPLYKQAAQKTGFELSVSAREGEPLTFWYSGDASVRLKPEMRTITIPEGRLGITITKPPDQADHAAFRKEFYKLKAEQKFLK